MKRILNRILAMLLAAILLAAPVCAAQTGYTDVPENAWYEEAIRTVTERGWMDGTGSGKFSPNATLTRAMLATVLWRMENCPAAAATGNFTDTVRGSWYDGGVSWCVAEGIFQGFPDSSFRPNDAITREQLALVFYRYADAKPTAAAAKVSVKNGCSWALDACAWANAEGLFTDALGTLDLCAPASRAEIAYWLAHFDVGTSVSSLTEGSFENLGYLLYTPENTSKNLPLLVYLHGGHGKGSDLSVLTTTDGFPQYLADGLLGEVPAYVLIPQLPANEKGWFSSADTVMALIDTICEEKTIDRSRIALTGHSMGGTGTWDLALAYPDIFSRIAPMGLTFKISGESFDKYDRSASYMNSTIVEYIEGIEVIKAFGRAGVSYEKYAGAINDFRTFVVKWLVSTMATMKLSFALFPSTLIGTLPVALALANRGVISAPQAALAMMLSISMVGSLAKLEVFSENMRQVKFTVENLEEFLEMPFLPEPAKRAEVRHTDVCLRDVHFSYTQEEKDEVLHGVNLTLPEGRFTALVGPSGGGKSTVAKLISRFWDVSSGSITIGGVDIREMPLSQLAEYVSFVTQDNFLFNCSLLENIRLGNPQATDEEVKAASKAAQCEEFIAKLPQGYDTPAGEAGKRLSGGEKQRVAIARMLLKNAPIVILDEATAFTDPENEDKIQRSIAALTRGKTLLVIAHRLSTIKNADNIVVLKDGAIAAEGTQDELLETCQLYRDMWQAHIGAKHWAVSSARKEG